MNYIWRNTPTGSAPLTEQMLRDMFNKISEANTRPEVEILSPAEYKRRKAEWEASREA